jgi:hypothetical protein
MSPPFCSLLLPLDGHRGWPRCLGGRPPTDDLLQGPHVRKVGKGSRGVVLRLSIIIVVIVAIALLL